MTNGFQDFDWSSANEDVVLEEQPRTAVYENPRGSIVIRQEGNWDDDSDPFVYFVPDAIPALIAALSRYAPHEARRIAYLPTLKAAAPKSQEEFGLSG